ncbi:hypothetical protein H4582DRAFT_2055337 [Lactarius indigo]|nr:hypothetical protein H4582DRAFT_2055329 [Lactarius indigo]KAI9441419.1 hypothetical protein H4582DRAFT_2055337 [Lactarius indigo]
MTDSVARCSATPQPDYHKLFEERLIATEKRLTAVERDNMELKCENDKLKTHCYFSGQVVLRLQMQVNSKEAKKGPARAKKTNNESRVLTSEEGRQHVQHLREEARLKELHQKEDLVRKAAEDQARRPLNKTRRKEELEDIAIALLLSDSGKKDDIYSRIMKEFEENPKWKSDPRFEGLFNPRPQKRARIGDIPVAGPSTTIPTPIPTFTYQFPPLDSPLLQPGIGPAATSNIPLQYPFTFTYP